VIDYTIIPEPNSLLLSVVAFTVIGGLMLKKRK
jgi:hypothetical protein